MAGDAEEGGGSPEVEVAGEAMGVGPLEAGTELAADAVAGVHQRGRGGGWSADFEGGGDVGHAVVAIECLGKMVGDVVGGRQ